jgi:hypothetical protein
MVQTSDSVSRLFVLTLWCWLVARLEFEREAVSIMGLADGIGKHQSSQEDDPIFLEEYFMRAYSHQRELDQKWVALMSDVFRTRKHMRGFAKDLIVCPYHAPFTCPRYVTAADMSSEEAL